MNKGRKPSTVNPAINYSNLKMSHIPAQVRLTDAVCNTEFKRTIP